MMPDNVDGNKLLAGGELGQNRRGITFSHLGLCPNLNTVNRKESQIARTFSQI